MFKIHIFHHNDLDGRAASSIYYEFLCLRYPDTHLNCEFHEIDYTVKIKLDKLTIGDKLVFLDYSFSNPDNYKWFIDAINAGYDVTWIDHHLTSEDIITKDELLSAHRNNANFKMVINSNYCATWLTYRTCYYALYDMDNEKYPIKGFNTVEIPEIVKYVQSYDLWKFDMPSTMEFHYGMEAYNYNGKNLFRNICNGDKSYNIFKLDDRIKELHHIFIRKMITSGETIIKYINNTSANYRKNYGFEITLILKDKLFCKERVYHGYAMNKSCGSFEFGDKINTYDFIISFIRKANDQWTYSIYRSDKSDLDCSKLASMIADGTDGLGGGGHLKASGFQTKKCIFDKGYNIKIVIDPILSKKPKVHIY